MNINRLVELIPQDTTDEGLGAVVSVVTIEGPGKAYLSCHLAAKFTLVVTARGHNVTIAGIEGDTFRPRVCLPDMFLVELRKAIYEMDDAVYSGRIVQTKPKVKQLPPPPADMDIPVWDEVNERWYDAEY